MKWHSCRGLRFTIFSIAITYVLQKHHPFAVTALFLCNDIKAQDAAHTTTMPQMPLTAPSNEANKKQLQSARAEGDSVDKCVQALLKFGGSAAGQTRAGEYIVTYLISKPEGWYELEEKNNLSWHEPTGANAHLWLFVQDGSDHRLVPGLTITASLENAQKQMPYGWAPLINGYGDNINLSNNKNDVITIRIAAPQYRRHDPYNGDRFTKTTTAVIPVSINQNQLAQQTLASEFMEEQTALSKGAGAGYSNTLKVMFTQANEGKDTVQGDYFIAFADEYSEGWWHYMNGKFMYMTQNDEGGKTNAHIEIAVLNKSSRRFLPDLNVTVTLYDKNKKSLGTKSVPFMWHPWLYHYGENWRIPSSGKQYSAHVHVDAPPYKRYGKQWGNQFAVPVDIDFDNLTIKGRTKINSHEKEVCFYRFFCCRQPNN